jgi:hypothetical protein
LATCSSSNARRLCSSAAATSRTGVFPHIAADPSPRLDNTELGLGRDRGSCRQSLRCTLADGGHDARIRTTRFTADKQHGPISESHDALRRRTCEQPGKPKLGGHPENDHVREGPIRLAEDGSVSAAAPGSISRGPQPCGESRLRRQAALYHGQHCDIAVDL